MKIKDIERALKSRLPDHFTYNVLAFYRDEKLDEISRSEVEAHLEGCVICRRKLLALREERAMFDAGGELTAVELAAIDRAAQPIEAEATPAQKPADAAADIALTERLVDYLEQAVADWKAYFARLTPVRGAERGKVEVWRWKSKDGVLTAYAELELNADLTIYISSSELRLENRRLKVRLGQVGQETTLRRVSESELRAEVRIPRRQRPKNLQEFSMEAV